MSKWPENGHWVTLDDGQHVLIDNSSGKIMAGLGPHNNGKTFQEAFGGLSSGDVASSQSQDPRIQMESRIDSITQKYGIYVAKSGPNKGGLMGQKGVSVSGDDLDFMRANKSAFVDRINQNEEREFAERLAAARSKTSGIDGLAELRQARIQRNSQKEAFARSMSMGDGILPAQPKDNAAEIAAMYPAAAAYLQAEEYSRASDDRKASAGRTAMNRIELGDDYATVISEMEKQWGKSASGKGYFSSY